MNHLIKFSDPVFTNLISNNMDKRVYTLEKLKKMKEIFLKINTGMQINGVEELNAKHVAGVRCDSFELYSLHAYCLQYRTIFGTYVNLYFLTSVNLDWTCNFVLQMSPFAFYAVV